MTLKVATVLGPLVSLSPSAVAADAECELDRPVVFAGLDWDSNAIHTAYPAVEVMVSVSGPFHGEAPSWSNF